MWNVNKNNLYSFIFLNYLYGTTHQQTNAVIHQESSGENLLHTVMMA